MGSMGRWRGKWWLLGPFVLPVVANSKNGGGPPTKRPVRVDRPTKQEQEQTRQTVESPIRRRRTSISPSLEMRTPLHDRPGYISQFPSRYRLAVEETT